MEQWGGIVNGSGGLSLCWWCGVELVGMVFSEGFERLMSGWRRNWRSTSRTSGKRAGGSGKTWVRRRMYRELWCVFG